MPIILIGYRCTGKTSVGKKLAQKMGIPFYDTDVMIMDRIGQTIKEWVEEMGWESFRQEEKEVIRKISFLDSAVIALGGGAILDPENREILKGKGPILWLTADVETILERMNSDPNNSDNRPALLEKDREGEIRELIAQRYPLYAQMAHLTIDTKGKTIEEIIEEIIKKIDF